MARRRANTARWQRIDQYASSMFRFEHLHEAWIAECSRYLQKVFGSRIAGATVMDYAFGRGNWSVAFARAGADRVVAIDASRSNVERLSDYCRRMELRNISIHHGNVMARPIRETADLVWVYGILHHVAPAGKFAQALSRMLRSDGEMLVYAYNNNCLRQIVVESARKAVMCPTEARFRRISYSLTPAARLRARDDLTAPYVRWYGGDELLRLFAPHGLSYVRSVESFQEFLKKPGNDEEFAPHHLILSRSGDPRKRPAASCNARQLDLDILRGMTDALLTDKRIPVAQRRAIALGLVNTHFSALEQPGRVVRCAFEDFLLLLHAVVTRGEQERRLTVPARDACRWARYKLVHGKVEIPARLRRSSLILDQICSQTIRL